MRTLLLDADALAYRASVVHQREYQWDEDAPPSLVTDPEDARQQVRDEIDRYMAELEADRFIICLSDDLRCFRKELVDQTYKANRKTVERPAMLYELKGWMRERFPSDLRPLLEADDVMGILASEPTPGEERIIVSEDKDMLTIPGFVYRRGKLRYVTQANADRWHLMQTLMGDKVDGYPGCPGVGEKTAAERLDALLGVESYEHEFTRGPRKGTTETRWRDVQMERPWDVVVSLFLKAGKTPRDALAQARLARILRFGEWNGRPHLWTPPAS